MSNLGGFAIALTMAVGLCGAATAAPALVPGLHGAGVQLVSGGCGPEGHRGDRGFCRPNRYVPRPCPYRFHMTPHGCRRDY